MTSKSERTISGTIQLKNSPGLGVEKRRVGGLSGLQSQKFATTSYGHLSRRVTFVWLGVRDFSTLLTA
jgi:hypothetical protein